MMSHILSDIETEGNCKIRRRNKPLMEKKRRARINKSLSQLKQILIQDQHQNSATHSKWEKADILEMTVEYLKELRDRLNTTNTNTTTPPCTSATPSTTQPVVGGALVPNLVMQQYMAYQQLAQISYFNNFTHFVRQKSGQ